MQNKSITPENPNCEFHHITINDYKVDIMHVFIQPIVDDDKMYNINAEFNLVHEWLLFEGEVSNPFGTLSDLANEWEPLTEVNEYMEKSFGIDEAKKLAEWLFTYHNDRFNSQTLYID